MNIINFRISAVVVGLAPPPSKILHPPLVCMCVYVCAVIWEMFVAKYFCGTVNHENQMHKYIFTTNISYSLIQPTKILQPKKFDTKIFQITVCVHVQVCIYMSLTWFMSGCTISACSCVCTYLHECLHVVFILSHNSFCAGGKQDRQDREGKLKEKHTECECLHMFKQTLGNQNLSVHVSTHHCHPIPKPCM